MTLICDFCSSPDVRWAYRCPNFSATVIGIADSGEQSEPIPWGSDGDWAACPVCKELIERGDRQRLARRSAKRLVRKHPNLSLRMALAAITPLHATFFERRVGPPIPERQEAR